MLGEGAGAQSVDEGQPVGVAERGSAGRAGTPLRRDRSALGASGTETAVADQSGDDGVAGLSRVTPGPTASITPAASWP